MSTQLLRCRAARWLGGLYLASGGATLTAALLVRNPIQLSSLLPAVPSTLAALAALLWLMIGGWLLRAATVGIRAEQPGARQSRNPIDHRLRARIASPRGATHATSLRR